MNVRSRNQWFPWLVVGATLLTSTGVRADEPPTWSMTLAELEAVGLGQSRGEPIPVPPELPHVRNPSVPKTHATPAVVFVNFDGAQLSPGADDSRTDTTQISALAGPFAAYGEGTKREAVMQALFTDWAAYDVSITDTRPTSGDYTMNMTGPTNPFGGGVLGIAPLDCNDAQTPNNVTFAFHSANDQFSATVQATTVSQEVAHSYGLEHVDEPGDIMNPFNAGGDASFIDACIPIVTNGQPIVCGSQHAVHCPGGTAQNAHLELLDLFGPAVPDTMAPTVAITSPNDGDVFEPGSDFEITVQASDDVAIEGVQLFNNGTPLQTDSSEPFGWDVEQIPEGEYALFVVARDTAGNETTSETITITVGFAASDDGSSGGDDEVGGTEGTGPDTDSGVGLDDDGATSGCGCSQGPPSGVGYFGLMVIGLGLSRRRRSASTIGRAAGPA